MARDDSRKLLDDLVELVLAPGLMVADLDGAVSIEEMLGSAEGLVKSFLARLADAEVEDVVDALMGACIRLASQEIARRQALQHIHAALGGEDGWTMTAGGEL